MTAARRGAETHAGAATAPAAFSARVFSPLSWAGVSRHEPTAARSVQSGQSGPGSLPSAAVSDCSKKHRAKPAEGSTPGPCSGGCRLRQAPDLSPFPAWQGQAPGKGQSAAVGSISADRPEIPASSEHCWSDFSSRASTEHAGREPTPDQPLPENCQTGAWPTLGYFCDSQRPDSSLLGQGLQ